jgi:PAS domain S-box-containing protein
MSIAQVLLEKMKSNDPELTTVKLNYENLTEADIAELADALDLNTHVTTLDVSGNLIGNGGMKILARPTLAFTTLIAADCNISDISELVKINRVHTLMLASNSIDTASIALLAESVGLRSLSLAANNIKDENLIVLAKNKSLTSLILSHNKITFVGISALIEHPSIVTLDVNDNYLNTEGIIAIAKNKKITSLAVAGNSVGLEGIQALASNETLTSLDVSYNKVGNPGALKLLQHPHLTYLNLSYNEVSFEGVASLDDNAKLQHLIISHNLLRDAGIIAIARHKTLLHLDASGNRVGFEGIYALAMNKTLLTLAFSSNASGDLGAVVFAIQNKTLKELIMSYNAISDAGAVAFATNESLKKLNLNYNMIGEQGKKALQESKTLTTLVLSPEQPPEFTDENLDTIFLLSESFLCICDLKGTLQFFNPSFSRALGHSQDDLLGKSFFKYLHPSDRPSLEQQLQVNKEAIIYNYENRYQCKDGSFRVVRWTSHIKHDRLYTVGTDITEQRQIEKEYLHIQQHALLTRVLEAETYNERQSQFISHLSHEIRNPLSGIFGLIESLQEQTEEVETIVTQLQNVMSTMVHNKLTKNFLIINGFFEDILACAEYQKTILNDNLDLVKITEKKLTLHPKRFELKKAIKELLVIFKNKAAKKQLVIQTIFPEDEEIWLKGDDLRFKQILVNLVGNAITFTQKGGIKITLTLSNQTAEQVQVNINVIDTGIGLTAEEVGVLFNRFAQANSSISGQYGGSGIGLYLAKQLAELMGGNITVSSIKGTGSNFSVIIPFALAPKKVLTIVTSEHEEKNSVTPSFKPKEIRVLIVDDNIINQKVLARIIAQAGYKYELANDGNEAVKAFLESHFDVILMDIIMPNKDGLTATREIRAIEKEQELPRIPIFAVSANAQEQDVKIGLAAGIDFYFTKPYKGEHICQMIEGVKVREVSKTPTPTIKPLKPSIIEPVTAISPLPLNPVITPKTKKNILWHLLEVLFNIVVATLAFLMLMNVMGTTVVAVAACGIIAGSATLAILSLYNLIDNYSYNRRLDLANKPVGKKTEDEKIEINSGAKNHVNLQQIFPTRQTTPTLGSPQTISPRQHSAPSTYSHKQFKPTQSSLQESADELIATNTAASANKIMG